MRVNFRFDAGNRHGLGHMMRSISLARWCVSMGEEVTLSVFLDGELDQENFFRGLKIFNLEQALHDDEDIARWHNSDDEIVILDSKAVTNRFLRKFGPEVKVVCFEDEIVSNLSCDILVNNHGWALGQQEKYSDSQKQLLGLRFNNVPERFFKRRPGGSGILLSMGGEDPNDCTTRVIKCLSAIGISEDLHVVIGPSHPNPNLVKEVFEHSGLNGKVHEAVTDLMSVLDDCAVAFSACGTACYELIASGVFIAGVAIEPHQKNMLNFLSETGFCVPIGCDKQLSVEKVRVVLDRIYDEDFQDYFNKQREVYIPYSGLENLYNGIFAGS